MRRSLHQSLDNRALENRDGWTALIRLTLVWLVIGVMTVLIVVEGKPLRPEDGEKTVKASLVQKRYTPPLAPDFSLKNLAGREVKLSDYQGKVVVINFWATWCGPCHMETPWLVELHQQYHKQGLEIIGIAVDSLNEYDPADVAKFAQEHQVSYPLVMATPEVVEAYGPLSLLPTTLVVDRRRRISYRHEGLIQPAELEREIKRLL
jgi:cytochrome c biogenesis protein CcmG/thiol:disulfide interchange protein DsbE